MPDSRGSPCWRRGLIVVAGFALGDQPGHALLCVPAAPDNSHFQTTTVQSHAPAARTAAPLDDGLHWTAPAATFILFKPGRAHIAVLPAVRPATNLYARRLPTQSASSFLLKTLALRHFFCELPNRVGSLFGDLVRRKRQLCFARLAFNRRSFAEIVEPNRCTVLVAFVVVIPRCYASHTRSSANQGVQGMVVSVQKYEVQSPGEALATPTDAPLSFAILCLRRLRARGLPTLCRPLPNAFRLFAVRF